MRYFDNLESKVQDKLFYKLPSEFNKDSQIGILKHSLGGTLYVPATKEKFSDSIIYGKYKDIKTFIIDLEDSIGDNSVKLGEEMFYENIRKIKKALKDELINKNDLPLIFLRVRNYEQFKYIVDEIIEDIDVLTGFVLPKANEETLINYLEIIRNINEKKKVNIYAMPTLECTRFAYTETRGKSLSHMVNHFMDYRDIILNVRIGVTDFSSIFGLRRKEDSSIYDINILKDIITDISNIMLRTEHDFVVAGCVYEYYNFKEEDVVLKTFLKEIYSDKLNGLIGKTIIHPNQAKYVQAISVVDYEDYMDAESIISSSKEICGAKGSFNKNRMNEVKPHMKWAEKIIKLSKVYGVYNRGESYRSLL